MTDTQDLIAQLRLGASISRDRNLNLDFAKVADEAADKLEVAQAEIERLNAGWKAANRLLLKRSIDLSNTHADLDQALARLAELTKQKPCAAISRCALYGAADCTCGVNGPCEGLTDVYLAAGASPVQPNIASVVRSDIDIHLSHCFQPPYDTSCKYGDDDCPATPKAVQPAQNEWKEDIAAAWIAGYYHAGYTHDVAYAIKTAEDFAAEWAAAPITKE